MKPPAPDLAVAVVVFAPDFPVLERTLTALERAAERAVLRCDLTIIDNGPGNRNAERLRASGARVLTPGRNLGFGAGHNLALRDARAEFVLVLNPDAELEEDALTEGLAFLRAHPEVVLLAPQVDTGPGGPRHLCKRDPDPWTLFVRGFGPGWLKRRYRARLDRYAMADLDPARENLDIPHASGCCMLLRTAAFRAADGFDERFFLYFEDLDLCRALRAAGGRVAYAPRVRIRHYEGGAARKGARHVRLFVVSAWKFFRKHGLHSAR
jgi:GT2 family glycosyltransferase